MAQTKHQQIPAGRATQAADVQRFMDAVRTQLNMLGGTGADRVLTQRDVKGGILTSLGISGFGSGGTVIGGGGGGGGAGGAVETPTQPTGVTGSVGEDITFLKWDRPTFGGYAYTEVWRFDADLLGSAAMVATVAQPMFSEYIGFDKTVYYWVRHVNTANTQGPYHATAGYKLVTKIDFAALQAALSEKIDGSYFAAALRSQILLLDANNPQGLVAGQLSLSQAQQALASADVTLNNAINLTTTRLGGFDGTSQRFSHIKSLEDASALLSRQVSVLGTWDNANSRFTEFATLKQTTADSALGITRLGAFDTVAGKYAVIRDLIQVDSGHATRLNTLETSVTDSGNSIGSKITRIENAAQKGATLYDYIAAFNNVRVNSIDRLVAASLDGATIADTISAFGDTNYNSISKVLLATKDSATKLTSLGTYSGGTFSKITALETTTANQATVISQLVHSKGDALRLSSIAAYASDYVGLNATPAQASPTLVEANGVIRATNSTQLYSAQTFKVRTSRKYQVRFVLRQVTDATNSGGQQVYAGVTTLDGNYQPITGGAGTHRYCAVVGNTVTVANGLVTYTGTITGEGVNHNEFRPGTVYVRPMLIVNYPSGNGTAEIVDFEIRDITDTAAVEQAARTYTDNATASMRAEYTLKVQANGQVAGFGITAGGTTGSEIYFSANRFAILPPNASSTAGAVLPFIYDSATGTILIDQAFIKDLTASKIAGGLLSLKDGNIRNLTVFEAFEPPAQFLRKTHLSPALAREIAWVDPTATRTGGSLRTLFRLDTTGAVLGTYTSGGLPTSVRITGTGIVFFSDTLPGSAFIGSVTLRLYRNGVAVTVNGSTDILMPISTEKIDTRKYILDFDVAIDAIVTGTTPNTAVTWRAEVYSKNLKTMDGSWFEVEVSVVEAFGSTGGLIANTLWSSIEGKPTTLAGFGITDGVSSTGGSFNGVVTFNSEVHTNSMVSVSMPMISADDHIGSPISIRERGRVAGAQSDSKYAPNLNFHWAGRVSCSLWMDAAGTLVWGAYESDGTPTANGNFSTSSVFASTFSTIGKGGMVLFNGNAGMVLRTQDAGGGFARGIIAENAAGTRLGGAGFYGDSNGVYSFAISLKENWWAAPQFEVVSNSVNINSTYLTLTSGWDISWGGRWWSGFPTITGLAASGGADASLSLYPNGNTGGRYYLTTSKLMFPAPFDAYMSPQGSGFFGLLTEVGNAKPLAVGGLLVSSAYNEVSSVPANGLLVRGSAVIGSHIDANAQEYVPSRSQLQIYSLNGSEARLAFHRGGYTVTTLAHDGDGLYLTNGTLRATGFKMNGRATTITTGAGNQDAISIQSPYGYIDIGALNSSFAHITTDRGYFYMNKELSVNGGFDVYGTQWFFGRGSKAKISSIQTRHIDGLSPDGTLYDTLYINYINNNDVMIGEGGGARLIAKSLINQVMARWASSEDARSVGQRAPTDYLNYATFEFLWGSTIGIGLNEYVGSLVFRPYGTGSDWSGGPIHKLHFAAGGRLFHQMGDGAGWGSHREIPQYEFTGYLHTRSWIKLPSTTGIYFDDNVTHLRHLGNGQIALQGSAGASFLRIDAAGGAQGFLYGETGGHIGLLDQNGSWILQCSSSNKMVYVNDITITSDSRLKDDQQLIRNALYKVRNMLNGKTYVRNDTGHRSAGLIAQDVQKALPEAVTTDVKLDRLTVNYNAVIGLLVEAIKELSDKVEQLEAQCQQ